MNGVSCLQLVIFINCSIYFYKMFPVGVEKAPRVGKDILVVYIDKRRRAADHGLY